ncbi:MAG: hydroxymethylbilane synthase [Alphaproteobacteria bacterium]
MGRTFRIASRRSKMALAQTNRIIAELKKVAPEHEYVIHEVVTDGDYEKFKGDLKTVGGKGAFVKALEVDLLNGKADMAMHSMKDVPGDIPLPEGLCIPAMLARDDLRDAVICRAGETFVGLKAGARIGTSSVRRGAQLKMAFPHLTIVPLRGNADTRVAKVDAGDVDAAILAVAGLKRIGLEHRISEVFEPDMMLPCVGQGVVGVECRENDADVRTLLGKINHVDTFTCITAERAMLRVLQGNCHTPIGGYCEITANRNLRLIGMVCSLDGKDVLRGRNKMPFDKPDDVGKAVAEELLAQGAKRLLEACA